MVKKVNVLWSKTLTFLVPLRVQPRATLITEPFIPERVGRTEFFRASGRISRKLCSAAWSCTRKRDSQMCSRFAPSDCFDHAHQSLLFFTSCHPMTAESYRLLREAIGSRPTVAKQLGISEATLRRRERLGTRISREAEIAITVIHMSGLRSNGKRHRLLE
jgi:hypothetical protein